MRDRGWIAAGLVLFAGLVTYPFWSYLAGVRTPGQKLKLALPAMEKECVAPVSAMKSSHMKLLIEWRDLVVRQNIRTYTAYNGKTFDINFTGTCLQRCHKDKPGFCDRCHEYNGVRGPYCWECHVDPGAVRQAGSPADTAGTGEKDGLR